MKVRDFYKKIDKCALECSIVFETSTKARGILIEKTNDFTRIHHPDLEAPIYDYTIRTITCKHECIVLKLNPKRTKLTQQSRLIPMPGTTDPDWGEKHWGQEGDE